MTTQVDISMIPERSKHKNTLQQLFDLIIALVNLGLLYDQVVNDDQVVNLGLLYYSPTVSKNLNAHINKGLNNFSDLRHIRYERITKYKEFTYAFESLHCT